MAYDGFAAKLAEVFSEPTYLSEDRAMPKVLEGLIKKDKSHQNLYVLDRGLMALDNYKKVSQADAVFVGRINTNRNMKIVRSLMEEDTDRDLGKLELVDDVIVHLYNKEEEDPQEFRVVKARFKKPTDTARKSPSGTNRKKTEQDVYFITNVTNAPGKLQLKPQEIAAAYRRRWDIEVFYYDKFIVMQSKVRSIPDNQMFVRLLLTSTSHNIIQCPRSLSQSRRSLLFSHSLSESRFGTRSAYAFSRASRLAFESALA